MKLGEIHNFLTKITYKDLDMYSILYHPRYFEILDTARNQSFQDYGYPIEEQLKDKVGFTVASIDNVQFRRPLFMAEDISVFTEVKSVHSKSCSVQQKISIGKTYDQNHNSVFEATFSLVFVDISKINEFPLNAENISRMRAIPFTEKVKSKLNFNQGINSR